MNDIITYRKHIKFENGYTASVICGGIYTYGGENGLFEVGILYNDALVLDTPLAEYGVIGWLDFAGVAEVLNKIKNLPPK